MSDPRNILVRLPNWVGDVVMATPALRALRQGFPEARITVEARPYMRDLMDPLDTVDEFLTYPYPERGLRMLAKRLRGLRAGRFDVALLMPDSQSAAVGPFLARIPRRIGYSRDLARRLLINEVMPAHKENGKRVPLSMIERYLRMTRHLGCPDAGREMTLAITDKARAETAARLAEHGVLPGDRVLLCITGASYGASKMWPAEYFAQAADELGRRHGLKTVLAPGPNEEAIGQGVAQHMELPCTVLVDPVLNLAQVAALVELSTLVISNDTGPRQMAVALKIPCVVPFGPTDRRYSNHFLENQKLLSEPVDCSPCGLKTCPTDHRCMRRLLPERIVAAAEEFLVSSPQRSG